MSKKVAIVFPGQGAQYVGMGKNVDDTYFLRAAETLNFDIKKLCFEGPEEELKLTKYTQPAIVTHSVALFEKIKPLLEEKNANIEMVLGHSVGEYSALTVAGSIKFEDAIKTVHLRGQYMQEAVAEGVGSMAAILKLDDEIVEKYCQEVSSSESSVQPANFNSPGQVVVSGHKEAVERLSQKMKEDDLKFRAMELKVSAPFHCSLMRQAADNLKPQLESIEIHPPKYNYIANVDAVKYSTDTQAETIKENLYKQICGSVKWTQSFSQISKDTLVIECGPGKVLAGLARKINPELTVLSIDQDEALAKLRELL